MSEGSEALPLRHSAPNFAAVCLHLVSTAVTSSVGYTYGSCFAPIASLQLVRYYASPKQRKIAPSSLLLATDENQRAVKGTLKSCLVNVISMYHSVQQYKSDIADGWQSLAGTGS